MYIGTGFRLQTLDFRLQDWDVMGLMGLIGPIPARRGSGFRAARPPATLLR
jgi:hypothetical protein